MGARFWDRDRLRWVDPMEAHRLKLESLAAEMGGKVVGNTVVFDVPLEAVERRSRVYFVGGDVGAIKIGVSIDPESRLKGIQTGSPIPLRILALTDGDLEVERAYHQRFAVHRLHGEWFERHPDILAEIERLRPSPSPAAEGLMVGGGW